MFSSSSYPALDTHEYENDRNPIENWNAYLRSIGMSTEPDHLDSSSDSNSNGTHSTSPTIMIDNEKNGDDDDEKMIHKFRHRNDILEATVYHRCVHPHNGIADTCRNVALILHDRQKYGAGWNRITLRQRRLLKRLPRTRRTTIDNGTDNNNPNRLKRNRGSNDNHICTDDNDDKRRYYYDESDDESDDYDDDESSAESPQYKDGERSPSTVFESPITTPQIHPLSVTTTSSTTIPSLSTPTVPGSASSIGRTSGDRDTIQASDGRFRNEFRNSGAALMEVDPIGSLTSATPAVDIAVKELTTSTSAAVGSMKGQGRFRAQFESAHKETAATVIADELTPPRSIFTKGDNNADIVVQPRRIRGSRSRRDSKSKVKKDKKKFHHVSYPMQLSNELRMFAEYTLTTKYHSSFLGHLGGNDPIDEQGIRPISSAAVSTISVAFSQDGKTMASTHGDHTVKITCCATGRLLQSLDGHPRTPWTVKYHPINSNVVASGCLGFQVRVWNWFKKTCLQMIRLEYAIISLSFHPSGTILAIANGTRLHFWGIDVCDNDDTQLNTTTSGITSNQLNVDPAVVRYNSSRGSTDRNINVAGVVSRQNSGSGNNSSSGSQSTSNSRASVTPMLIELDQKHMLRCVHFPPNGTSLIIGGANPPIVPPDVLSRSGRGGNAAGGANGGLSFYLRMWKFDLKKAFESVTPPPSASASAATTSSNSTGTDVVAPLGLQQHPPLNQRNMLMARRGIITNPILFVPRVLLYNDGGFDVSPDGRKLCACAEFWLPDGVNSASELLQREQLAFDDAMRQKEEGNELERATEAMRIVVGHQNGTERREEQSKVSSTNTETNSSPTVGESSSELGSLESHYTAAVSAALENLRSEVSTPTRAHKYYSRFGDNSTAITGVTNRNLSTSGRSASFRDGMEHPIALGPPATPLVVANTSMTGNHPRTPATSGLSVEQNASFIPLTPPITVDQRQRNLSPPPPPGGQVVYGRPVARRRQTVTTMNMEPLPQASSSTITSTSTSNTDIPPTQQGYTSMRSLAFHLGAPHQAHAPPPTTSSPSSGIIRPPHHLSYISTTTIIPSANGGTLAPSTVDSAGNLCHADAFAFRSGRYVPHVVTISLDTDPLPEGTDANLGRSSVARGYQPRLGQLLQACPLDVNKASAVTCVKFSPSTDFCLIGYGVREPGGDSSISMNINGNHNLNNSNFHPVTAIYRIRGGMTHVSTMLSADDDVNIARFHPDSGNSFVYGTKQGRVRVLSKRPWNFYDYS